MYIYIILYLIFIMLLFPSYTVFGFWGLLRGPTLIAEEFKRRFWQSRGQTTSLNMAYGYYMCYINLFV